MNPAAGPAVGERLQGWPFALRVAAVSALPMLVTLTLMWPALWPAQQRLAGTAKATEACVWRWCGEVVQIEGRPLACRLDLIGLPADCRLRNAPDAGNRSATPAARLGEAGLPVEATVQPLPSLLSVLGLGATDGLLLRLDHGEQTLFRRSLRQHAWGALYGSGVFHAIYWPLVGLVLALWPGSALSRRLWARITWTKPAR